MTLIALGFSSCSNNDGYSIGDIGISWATVKTIGDSKAYYLDSDNFGSLWIGGSRIFNFTPKDGERVVAVFNPLVDNYEGYDMAILLEDLYPVLTKKVITDPTDESLGNSPITISKGHMWVAAGYLNLIYQQTQSATAKPTINLVYNEENSTDEYIGLDLFYNNSNQNNSYTLPVNVSFDLSTLNLEEKKGIDVTINSIKNGKVTLRIDITDGKEIGRAHV